MQTVKDYRLQQLVNENYNVVMDENTGHSYQSYNIYWYPMSHANTLKEVSMNKYMTIMCIYINTSITCMHLFMLVFTSVTKALNC